MTSSSEPGLAAIEFSPFTHAPPRVESAFFPLPPPETAILPKPPLGTTQSQKARPTRPRRPNLLAMGMLCGQDADLLDARAAAGQTLHLEADRTMREAEATAAARLPAPPATPASAAPHRPATTAPPAAAAGPATPANGQTASRQQAITALAEQVQVTHLERRRLTDELAALDEKEKALRQQLTELLRNYS